MRLYSSTILSNSASACVAGAGALCSPSSRQIRCTRLWLTLQPSIRRRR
jgi:hypothetical protein